MIGILTYPIPHQKTQDIVLRLLKHFEPTEICLIRAKYGIRPKRDVLINHRPDNPLPYNDAQLADVIGSFLFKNIADAPKCDFYIIGGCGIISDIGDKLILNSHPGYLPNVRGLDALKWALYEGQPIGITVHAISDKVDLGEVYHRAIIVREPFEDFYHLAMRQYKLEIDALIHVAAYFSDYQKRATNIDAYDREYPVHKRMDMRTEAELLMKMRREW